MVGADVGVMTLGDVGVTPVVAAAPVLDAVVVPFLVVAVAIAPAVVAPAVDDATASLSMEISAQSIYPSCTVEASSQNLVYMGCVNINTCAHGEINITRRAWITSVMHM